MKKVYIVRLSEDGVQNEVFTNVKALYNYLEHERSSYIEKAETVGYESKKYSYQNLVNCLKRQSSVGIYYGNYCIIQIITANINTKF